MILIKKTPQKPKNMMNRSFQRRLKGVLSGLRQFFTTGRPLKMVKNVSYFTLKALLVI